MPITDEVREKIAAKSMYEYPAPTREEVLCNSNLLPSDRGNQLDKQEAFERGAEYGYSLALAELLTKGESNSPWIKASVRQPSRQVAARRGEMNGILGPWFGNTFWFWITEFNTGKPTNVTSELESVEWLDEEKLSRMVAELEAARKENEQLGRLLEASTKDFNSLHDQAQKEKEECLSELRTFKNFYIERNDECNRLKAELEAKDKRIAELKGLVREICVRANIVFPQTEDELRWFDEKFINQGHLMTKIDNL